MSENRNPDVVTREIILYLICNRKCSAFFVTFGNNYQVARFLTYIPGLYHLFDIAGIAFYFRNQNNYRNI